MFNFYCNYQEQSLKGNFLMSGIIVLYILFIFTFFSSTVNADYYEITDMSGREVEVPATPERIVAMSPGMLRKVVYLNAENKIVGVEETEVEPFNFIAPYQLATDLEDLPVIGPIHGGDAELIAGVEPDLVLFSGNAGDARDLSQKLSVPVVNFELGDIYNYRSQLFEALELLGEILNREKRSKNTIQFIKEIIEDLDNRTKSINEDERPRVYAGGMSYRGGHGFSSVRYPFPPFKFLNARDVTDPYLDYEAVTQINLDRELLFKWDPEVIFIDLINYDLIKNDFKIYPEYSALSAVQKGKIYGLLPYASYHVNFCNVLANSYYIGSVIYPLKFADIVPEEKADYIYNYILGTEVYEKMKAEYGGFGSVEGLK